jgi:dephospho-CoA kinase
MDEERPRKRQTTKFIRSARAKRILKRLREGFGSDEIGRQEKLTERGVRQIVAEALEGRAALESAVHARSQIDRLGRAARSPWLSSTQAEVQSLGRGRTPFLSRPQPRAAGCPHLQA